MGRQKGRSLTAKELRDIGADELISIVDNLRELGNGELNEDDIFSIVDLALGIDKNTLQSIRKLITKNPGVNKAVPERIVADIPSTPVHNINEFFTSITGGVFKTASSRTSKIYDGQRVYRADKDIVLQDGTKIRRGDQFYLDGLHKNHLEVFDARGNPRIKVDLAGNNLGELPSGRTLK